MFNETDMMASTTNAKRSLRLKGRRRLTLGCALLLIQTGPGEVGTIHSQDSVPSAPVRAQETVAVKEVQGRLVCLPEEMHRRFQADLPANHRHILGFRTDDGAYYTLLRTQLSLALFEDKRLAAKELLLKGRVYPGTHILDVSVIRSIHDGVVYDLYYWCDVCSIKSVVPGPCMCCQQDVVLVEKPLRASPSQEREQKRR
jgi:hypothetical protein